MWAKLVSILRFQPIFAGFVVASFLLLGEDIRAAVVELSPVDIIALHHDEFSLFNIQIVESKSAAEKLIQERAKQLCRLETCGNNSCRILVSEQHEKKIGQKPGKLLVLDKTGQFVVSERSRSTQPDYYFSRIVCSDIQPDGALTLVFKRLLARHILEKLIKSKALVDQATSGNIPDAGCDPSVRQGEGVAEPIGPADKSIGLKPSASDIELADQTIDAFIDAETDGEDGQLGLSQPTVVKAGVANYLADCRRRGISVSEEFMNSIFEVSDTPGTIARDQETLKQAIKGAKEFPKKPVDKIRAGAGASAVVYQVDDGHRVFFFKKPSPLTTKSASRARRKIFSEVAAYRINKLLGANVIEETNLMVETTEGNEKVLGSERTALASRFGPVSDSIQHDSKITDLPSVSQLRAVDYIARVQDRNNGNVFYDPKKKEFRGLDYEGTLLGLPLTDKVHPLTGGRFPADYDVPMGNDPQVTIKNRINSVTYEELHKSLQDVATEQEIESVWMRFHILRADIVDAENRRR